MNQGPLSAFIEAQRSAGKVESAGTFTLAIEKARDKLASHTLGKPEEYILKLVQAAVALQVDELFIELQRSAVLFFFEVPQSNGELTIEHLADALFSPLQELHQGRAHLALALSAMAATEPVELMWGEWGTESSQILSLGRGRSELFRDPPFPRTQTLAPDRRFHLLYLKKQSSGVSLSQTAEEGKLLKERCCFAPVSIRLDGSPLEPALPRIDTLSDPIRQLISLYLGALRFEQQGPCLLRWPGATREPSFLSPLPSSLSPVCAGFPPTLISELPESLQLPLSKPFSFSALHGVPCFLYGSSHIHYLKDGVLLDPITTHEAGGGAFSILDGQALKTDITGLRAVENEQVAIDKLRAVQAWKALIDRFVQGDPPLYQNTIVASGRNLVDQLLSNRYLRRTVKPFYDYFTQKDRRQAIELKKFRRMLENRRSYLAYFRD